MGERVSFKKLPPASGLTPCRRKVVCARVAANAEGYLNVANDDKTHISAMAFHLPTLPPLKYRKICMFVCANNNVRWPRKGIDASRPFYGS